nr:hypothetical protein [Variovorax boronicumulans]
MQKCANNKDQGNMFVSIEGIDGSGKSSTVNWLSAEGGIEKIQKKNAIIENGFINDQYSAIRAANYPAGNGEYDHLMGSTYWIYMQCVWYSLLYEHVIKPKIRTGKTVVVDGWTYKFRAKVLREIEDKEIINRAFSLIPDPDMVVMLDVDPTLALSRREKFTHYEAGSHSGQEFSKESFIHFQRHIRKHLIEQSTGNWAIVPVNEAMSLPEVGQAILSVIGRN